MLAPFPIEMGGIPRVALQTGFIRRRRIYFDGIDSARSAAGRTAVLGMFVAVPMACIAICAARVSEKFRTLPVGSLCEGLHNCVMTTAHAVPPHFGLLS